MPPTEPRPDWSDRDAEAFGRAHRQGVAAPPPTDPTAALRTALDPERLRQAYIDVSAGYINAPDYLTPTYWRKVVRRYDYLTSLASQADDPSEAWTDVPGHGDQQFLVGQADDPSGPDVEAEQTRKDLRTIRRSLPVIVGPETAELWLAFGRTERALGHGIYAGTLPTPETRDGE